MEAFPWLVHFISDVDSILKDWCKTDGRHRRGPIIQKLVRAHMPFWHQKSDVVSLAKCLQFDVHGVSRQAVYYIRQCVLNGPSRQELLRVLSSCFQALDLVPNQSGENSAIRNDSSLQEELFSIAGLAVCLQYSRILSQPSSAAVRDASDTYKALESEAVIKSLSRNPKVNDGVKSTQTHQHLTRKILLDMGRLKRGNETFRLSERNQCVDQYEKKALGLSAVEKVALIVLLWVQV